MFAGHVASLLVVHLAFTISIEGHCIGNDDTCLMKYLKSNMELEDVDVRPAFNHSATTNVKFGIGMTFIDSLKEIGNNGYEITISSLFRHSWVDARLSWDPEDFGGIREIRIPIQYIWKPDLVLYNNRELKTQMNTDALAIVRPNGAVVWVPMGKMTVLALRNQEWWLKDVFYNARFKFGSRTYDVSKLDVDFFDDFAGITLEHYSAHGRLSVVEQTGRKNVMYYPCCDEPYPDLTFRIKLKVL